MASEVKCNLALQKKLLKIAGVSLNENESAWYNLYALMITCYMWSYPVTVFHSAITSQFNLEDLLENLAYGTAAVNALSKISATFRVRKQLGKALHFLNTDMHFAPNSERGGAQEEVLMNECTFYANVQIMVLCVMAIGNIILSIVETLIPRLSYNDPHYWKLPYGEGFAVFNATYSPNFEAVLVFKVTTMTIICLGFVAVTTFIAGVMAYVSYQFKMLQNFTKIAVDRSKEKKKKENDQDLQLNSGSSEFEWKHLQETVKEIVDYHSAIIKLAETFEELLNIPALIDFLGLSLVICLALFTCNVLTVFNLRLVNQLILAAGNIFLQFITAYWGNQVITESEALIAACYEAEYIGTDIRFQRSLIIVMERSQKRIQFTVGKFAPLSLRTFQKVIQTSYSYFMLLNNIKK